jgi:cell division protein FtsB
MDESTRSNYRLQISRSRQQIGNLEQDRAALVARINRLEEGKYELTKD